MPVVTRSELERLDTLCAGIVTRAGEMDACCKPATTIVWEPEYATTWPACTWHAHRYGGSVPLSAIRDAITKGAGSFERPEVVE